MKIVVGLTILLLWSAVAFGQGVFDSNCYFPEIGKPDEIDTMVSPYSEQGLGNLIRNLGPEPNSTTGYGRIAFQGYKKGNFYYHTSFKTGPDFDIHSLTPLKTMKMEIPRWAQFGYFRSPRHRDLLIWGNSGLGGTPKIYWADDDGNYDSSRVTVLFSKLQGDPSTFKLSNRTWLRPYIADLNGDSLDDIVTGVQESHFERFDSSKIYVLFYNGTEAFTTSIDTVYADTTGLFGYSAFIEVDSNTGSTNGNYRQYSVTGDFRGTGAKDLVAYDVYKNAFFYRNDRQFSMKEFIRAIKYDTLIARWQNPTLPHYQLVLPDIFLSMKVYSKPSWDHSDDLLINFHKTDSGRFLYPFRGGPEFGSKRLTLDRAEFAFHHPYWYSSKFSTFDIVLMSDCGDMTGTGNRVLYLGGEIDSHNGASIFYVLGKALDDKIDMFFEGNDDLYSGYGLADTVTGDNDNLQDMMMGVPSYDSRGSVYLIRGSKDIPVTLNPKYKVSQDAKLTQNQLTSYPNPLDQKTTLTFENRTSGVMYMEVVSSIGVSVLREEIPDVEGLQQYAADLSALPAGAYHIRLVCPTDGWSAGTNVIKTGTAVAP